MKKVIIISLLSMLIGLACKKKTYPEPAPIVGDAAFYAECLLDEKPFNLISGDKDYYLYTACNTGKYNVYEMTGEFKQIECTNCNNSLRIQINDSRIIAPGQAIDINYALKIGQYEYVKGGNDGLINVNFLGAFNKPGSSYTWDFGDGTSSNELNPQHLFKPGIYKVKFTGLSTENCYSSIENTINLKDPDFPNACIKVNQYDTLNLFSVAILGGKKPFKYLWEFGDGKTSTDSVVFKNYLLKGTYAVKLTITDANGKKSSVNYNAISSNDVSFCSANFSMKEIALFDSRNILSKIKIDVTDEFGTRFTSDNLSQPNTSTFEILAVEDFMNNRNNEKVKRIKVRFDCLMYSESKSTHLQSKEVYFAVAYK